MTTAQTLITRARYRTDKLNSTFVNDTNDLLPWTDHGHRELYDLLIAAYSQEYFMTTVDMFVSASTEYSTLATYLTGANYTDEVGDTIGSANTNFYKLIRFDRCGDVYSSVTTTAGVTYTFNRAASCDTRVPFRPFEFSDAVLSDKPCSWPASGSGVQYRITGGRIYWHPSPDAKQFVRMYYVPLPGTLTALTDSVDTWCEPWLEYVELYVARAIREKEQDTEGVNSITQQLLMVQQRIAETAPPRDIGQPQTIVDVRSNDEAAAFWPDRWW